jgi:hypothetical protein
MVVHVLPEGGGGSRTEPGGSQLPFPSHTQVGSGWIVRHGLPVGGGGGGVPPPPAESGGSQLPLTQIQFGPGWIVVQVLPGGGGVEPGGSQLPFPSHTQVGSGCIVVHELPGGGGGGVVPPPQEVVEPGGSQLPFEHTQPTPG